MKVILFFILLYTVSFSQNIVKIDSNTTDIEDFKVAYLIDNLEKFTFKDVNSMQFIEGKSSETLGANTTNTWVKIELENSTKDTQTLFLHQDEAYTLFSIDFYEVDTNGSLLNKLDINIYSTEVEKSMLGSDAVFTFTLAPQERKTLYIQQKTLAYHYYNFRIFSKHKSQEYLIFEKVGLFKNLCQSGKITNTKGHRDEDRNRCRTIC